MSTHKSLLVFGTFTLMPLSAMQPACGDPPASTQATRESESVLDLGDLLTPPPEPTAAGSPQGSPPQASPPTGIASPAAPPTARGDSPAAPSAGSDLQSPDEQQAEQPQCTKARAALRETRQRVDQKRQALLEPAESAMLAAKNALSSCFTNTKCAADYEHLAALKARADSAASRFQAVQQQVAQLETTLFPLDQAVDRACGRPR